MFIESCLTSDHPVPAHPESCVDVVPKHVVVEAVLVVDPEDEVPGQGGQQLPQLPRATGGTRPVLPRDRGLGDSLSKAVENCSTQPTLQTEVSIMGGINSLFYKTDNRWEKTLSVMTFLPYLPLKIFFC